jgi:mannitol 2-dehydrogenase
MGEHGVREFLTGYMRREVAPTLEAVEKVDVDAYIDSLMERFGNPMMSDTILRLATDGANRMATFTLPAVRANLEAGRPVVLGALMVAAWAVFWERIAAGDVPRCGIPDDVNADTMMVAALTSPDDPAAFIRQRELFGSLSDDVAFTEAYITARERLLSLGVTGAVSATVR